MIINIQCHLGLKAAYDAEGGIRTFGLSFGRISFQLLTIMLLSVVNANRSLLRECEAVTDGFVWVGFIASTTLSTIPEF